MSQSAHPASTASADEVARFTAMAESWWDPEGKFKPLHRFNPVRVGFARSRLARHFGRDPALDRPFEGLSLLDVGCGGGLLSEPLARLGFAVSGIDAGEKNVAVAALHARQSELPIAYRVAGPEDMGQECFDVVLGMEVIEHVPDQGRFVSACARALKPGGAFVGATLNRTLKAYGLAVIGAEYVMGWLPKGTHDWNKFVKPSEFATLLRRSGIETHDLVGMSYAPLKDEWRETTDIDVNYMIFGVKV